MRKLMIGMGIVTGVFAQTAEVHDLLPAETAQGVALYKAKLAADNAYYAWADQITVKYIDQTKNCNTVGSPTQKICHTGEFSDGFKYIVPSVRFVSRGSAVPAPGTVPGHQ